MSGQPDRNLPEQPPHLQPVPPAPPQQEQQHPQTEVPASPVPPSSSQAASSDAASPPSAPPVGEQARVATVLYDMLLRGGPNADTLSAHLAAAYPGSALIAREYAAYARQAVSSRIPYAQARERARTYVSWGAEFQRQPRGDFVLKRISVGSVAWFCFFIGSLLASLRLCFIFSLALAATLAHSQDSAFLYNLVDNIATESFGEGPRGELYKWIFRVLTEQNPIAEFGQGDEWLASVLLPSYISAALLLTPITAGVLCFLLGGMAAVSVNFALRAAGGIRFENHDD